MIAFDVLDDHDRVVTTMPIASTSPNNVGRLMLKPNSAIARNVPTSDTGIAAIGISVERTPPRNTSTTRITSPMASSSVL